MERLIENRRAPLWRNAPVVFVNTAVQAEALLMRVPRVKRWDSMDSFAMVQWALS